MNVCAVCKTYISNMCVTHVSPTCVSNMHKSKCYIINHYIIFANTIINYHCFVTLLYSSIKLFWIAARYRRRASEQTPSPFTDGNNMARLVPLPIVPSHISFGTRTPPNAIHMITRSTCLQYVETVPYHNIYR